MRWAAARYATLLAGVSGVPAAAAKYAAGQDERRVTGRALRSCATAAREIWRRGWPDQTPAAPPGVSSRATTARRTTVEGLTLVRGSDDACTVEGTNEPPPWAGVAAWPQGSDACQQWVPLTTEDPVPQASLRCMFDVAHAPGGEDEEAGAVEDAGDYFDGPANGPENEGETRAEECEGCAADDHELGGE